jgi:hypothetical protein
MNPLVWLQSLVTFRKSGGSGLQVPELDSAGRIRISMVTANPIEASATPPTTTDGTVLWYNTTTQSVFFYDTTRSKWLGAEVNDVLAGRSGTTPPGNFYRGQDSMVLDAGNRGLPVSQGCLTSIAWSRTDTGSATLEVLVNGTAVAELNASAAGATRSDSFNADFSAGLMSFRNKAALSNTQNVQIAVQYRRRP